MANYISWGKRWELLCHRCPTAPIVFYSKREAKDFIERHTEWHSRSTDSMPLFTDLHPTESPETPS